MVHCLHMATTVRNEGVCVGSLSLLGKKKKKKRKSKVWSGALCEEKGRHCKNSETTSLGGDWPVMEEAVHVNRFLTRKLTEACENASEGL